MITECLDSLQRQRPEFLKSALNSRELNPELFETVGNQVLRLLNPSNDRDVFDSLCRSYCAYTYEQNKLQLIYEISGAYPQASHGEANDQVYQNHSVMSEYMKSLLLTQFLWPHHLQIVRFFTDAFSPLLAQSNSLKVAEFAPGHGMFGRLLLQAFPAARLSGYDISPVAVRMAQSLADQEGLGQRAAYTVMDVLAKSYRMSDTFDAIVAGELMEHLDDPRVLCESIEEQLVPGGLAFITAALTAANLDHVYEFKDPEEVTGMVSGAGFEIIDQIVASPPSVRPGTKRIPRVQALIVRKHG